MMWELHGTAGPSQHFPGHDLVVTGLAVSPGEGQQTPSPQGLTDSVSCLVSDVNLWVQMPPSCAQAPGTTPCASGTLRPGSVWAELQSPGIW